MACKQRQKTRSDVIVHYHDSELEERQGNKTANYIREYKENHMFFQMSNNWKDKKLEDLRSDTTLYENKNYVRIYDDDTMSLKL